jgi:hypothetical protein
MINCFLSLSPYLTVNTVYLNVTGELMHARRDNEMRFNFGIFISPFVRIVLILDCVLRVKMFYYLPALSNQMWYGVTDWVTELAEYNRRSHVYISIILTKNKKKQNLHRHKSMRLTKSGGNGGWRAARLAGLTHCCRAAGCHREN